jgi:hypothetical protein
VNIMRQIQFIFSVCTPLAIVTTVCLAQPALAMPDLSIARLERRGSPVVRGDVIEVPIRVTVRNQGTSASGAFKVSTEFTARGESRAYAVAFTVGSDIWYPRVTSLAAGRDVVLNGKVSFLNSLRGKEVALRAIADSCSGDEFMPTYCRVRESNESNNRSASTTISLPALGLNFSPTQQREILDAHNRYRRAVPVPLLTWSNSLATSARLWAEQVANRHLDGSWITPADHSGAGENIWQGSLGSSLRAMIDLWGNERRFFRNGVFDARTIGSAISTTGNWQDVGHYTQIVWRNTKQVGCGLARTGRQDFLVCRYNPAGNIVGQRVY